jgi:CopG family nickel-responsive transcriptional regulator
MVIVSLSLTTELLDNLDEYVEKSGYSSRSEAIRLAVREVLSAYRSQRHIRGEVVSTVTIISVIDINESHIGVMDLRNGFDENIFGNMHLHIEGGYCVEIFLLKGDIKIILDFVQKAKAIRGVREVAHTVTPL